MLIGLADKRNSNQVREDEWGGREVMHQAEPVNTQLHGGYANRECIQVHEGNASSAFLRSFTLWQLM